MNCIIVDDEPIARSGITALIDGFQQLHLKATFNNAESAGQYLQEQDIDLVFLDIQMPGINGIDFARSLGEKTLVIFTTAYSQYALESYEVDAIDYLVKPISNVRFARAVEKATLHFSMTEKQSNVIDEINDDYVLIRADRRFHKVALDKITYIEGLKDYVIIYTKDMHYISWINLKNIHMKLPRHMFLRVSKSHIVNHHSITSFDNHSIYIGEQALGIGKAYQEDFFRQYIGRTEP